MANRKFFQNSSNNFMLNIPQIIRKPSTLNNWKTSRFRHLQILVIGCGNVGFRVLKQKRLLHLKKIRFVAITSNPQRQKELRALGVRVLTIDLDDRKTTQRIGALTSWSLIFVPPDPLSKDKTTEPRIRNLIAAQRKKRAKKSRVHSKKDSLATRWCYISTSGVYGDCQGAICPETFPIAPKNIRAQRRANAENLLRETAKNGTHRIKILRAPAIYTQEDWPSPSLIQKLPILCTKDDIWSNHIHADDLANIAWLSLFRGKNNRVINAADDSPIKMGDYFDIIADTCGIQRPPRLPRERIVTEISPQRYEFMSESRRLSNQRLKEDLRVRLRYRTVMQAAQSWTCVAQGIVSQQPRSKM